jgi:hypothetical protein
MMLEDKKGVWIEIIGFLFMLWVLMMGLIQRDKEQIAQYEKSVQQSQALEAILKELKP